MPIVKVQVPLCSTETNPRALVYDEPIPRLRRVRLMPLSEDTLAALGDDVKGYYDAEWKGGGWVIGARVSDRDW